MSAPQNRQAITALREKAHVAEQYAVCSEGDWYVDAKLAGKPLSALPLGLSRVGGQRWYREGDHVLALSCALPVPPDDALRDIAHQLLEERLAQEQERKRRQVEQAHHEPGASI